MELVKEKKKQKGKGRGSVAGNLVVSEREATLRLLEIEHHTMT